MAEQANKKELAAVAATTVIAYDDTLANSAGSLLVTTSHFVKLVRITAYIIRFTHNCRAKKAGEAGRTGELTKSEFLTAELYWVKASQRGSFAKEIHSLETEKSIIATTASSPFYYTVHFISASSPQETTATCSF